MLFMVIIGGLGSLLGSFFGAALIYGLPIVLRYDPPDAFGIPITSATVEHINFMIVGRAHHFLPDRRAGRAGAALADRKAETQGVAFPILKVHT